MQICVSKMNLKKRFRNLKGDKMAPIFEVDMICEKYGYAHIGFGTFRLEAGDVIEVYKKASDEFRGACEDWIHSRVFVCERQVIPADIRRIDP